MELNMELKQTQTLTPQMVQFMEFLQMGTMELREYLQNQLQENPVLEMDERMTSPPSRQDIERDQLLQKIEWLHSTDIQSCPVPAASCSARIAFSGGDPAICAL